MTGQKLEMLSSGYRNMAEKSLRRESPLTCFDILKATGGCLIRGDKEAVFAGLSTDSRSLQRGEVFLALRGERFDGHAFVAEALKRDAGGVIVETVDLRRDEADVFGPRPIIAVPDTLRALGDIARFWRNRFTLPVIGITGSNGKTTTKEIIASLLEQRFRVLRNPGNFNNLVGLPLTLLDLNSFHQVVVVEMGTNIPGEIERLAEIARPTIGLITNIGQAHLEGMGSLENLVKEKGRLFRSIGAEGIIAVNQNDPHIRSLADPCRAEKVRFGIETEADVVIDRIEWRRTRGTRFRLTVRGERISVALPALGDQLLHGVAAAVAVASVLDLSLREIKERLELFKPLPMRMEVLRLQGLTFINDAYNANPPSVEMALKVLSHASGKARTFVVFGDMLELGKISPRAHRDVGRLMGRLGVTGVFLLGDHAHDVAEGAIGAGMNPRNVWVAHRHSEIADLLRDLSRPGDWVLVKGSRRMRMETVIEVFRGEA